MFFKHKWQSNRETKPLSFLPNFRDNSFYKYCTEVAKLILFLLWSFVSLVLFYTHLIRSNSGNYTLPLGNY